MDGRFELDKVVATSDLGRKGCLKLRSLIDYLQDCSVFQLDTEPELDKYFKSVNGGMFLSQRDIHIIRMPKYGERVKVKTWVYEVNPSYGYRNNNVYDEEGRVCVESSALGVFVKYDTGALLRVPQDIMDSMPRYERHAMEYRPRKIRIPKDIEPELVDEYRVREYHIDGNKHMNNAWYVAIGEEYLPRDWEFSRIRIEYLIPAIYGDVMRIERYKINNPLAQEALPLKQGENSGNGYIVVMRREDGKIYSIIEFI